MKGSEKRDMLTNSGLVSVYKARDSQDLIVKRSILEAYGIPVTVDSDSINELFGLSSMPLQFDDSPGAFEIFVSAEKAGEAVEILRAKPQETFDEGNETLPPDSATER